MHAQSDCPAMLCNTYQTACLLRHQFPQVIGVILASALLIIPAASASLLAKRMSSYLWIAATLGAVSGFVSLSFLSWGKIAHRPSYWSHS